MGYCEGVYGRFYEVDVDFESTTTAANPLSNNSSNPSPISSRNHSRTISPVVSNKKNQATEVPPVRSRLRKKKSTTMDEVSPSSSSPSPAISAPTKHALIVAAMATDPSQTDRSEHGPRKLMSEENLKVVSAQTIAARRRQVISSPPAPHPELLTVNTTATTPVIPPRSSSRLPNGASSPIHSPHDSPSIHSLATKSSISSMNSQVATSTDPHGSSATMSTNSLEGRPYEANREQQHHHPTPVPRQQPSRPSSPTLVSGTLSVDVGSIQSPLKSIGRLSPNQSLEANHPQQDQKQEDELTKGKQQQENDNYLSSVLEDIRAKTSHVLQKMSPTAGLFADHGSKDLDLSVVQMPSTPIESPPSHISVSTAAPAPASTIASATAPSSPTSGHGVSFAIPAPDSPERGLKAKTGISGISRIGGRARSRSVRDDSRPPLAFTLLGSSGADSSGPAGASPSIFDKLRPSRLEQRRRSNSGPARHSDSSIQQKLEEYQQSIGSDVDPVTIDNDKSMPPSPPQDTKRKPRSRRPSAATTVTMASIKTTHSCPPPQHEVSAAQISSKQLRTTKNWFGIRRNSTFMLEDTRAPHPLGHGIEGGIVNRHVSSLVDEDDDEDDYTEDEAGAIGATEAFRGRKSMDQPNRLFINDYGFIYDLDDEMNQGQDLSGTGSSIGKSGSTGSSVSIISEIERKKVIRKQKFSRENELKWIHAVTRLQVDTYKKLVRRGLPTSVRGRVWLFLAKADSYRQPGLFEELCKRGPLPIHEVIERDIHRCYPDHVHFRDGMGGTGQQDLHSILKAYAHYKPSVGYCQGMGRLVGMMLMQMPVEDAFWLLVATIEGYMQDYYTPSLRQLRVDAQVFERLLKEQDPPLASHLEKNDVIPLMYMTQWFMTLYTMSLPWASVLRVWDVFYFDGVKALFRVGLAILQLSRDHLLSKCPSSSELLAYILHIPLETLAPKQLLETALQIKLRKQSVQKLIAVTAESMDAAATTSKKSASVHGALASAPSSSKATAAAAAIGTKNSSDNSQNSDTQQSTASSPPVSSSSSAVGSTSFSPLGVFKTRKRAGTLHK
ncbi:hypothetical protein BX616_005510 [Lobosporangium transversale]|nr:hypothetical protein BX616_005510 [Lobosporangium transversale]